MTHHDSGLRYTRTTFPFPADLPQTKTCFLVQETEASRRSLSFWAACACTNSICTDLITSSAAEWIMQRTRGSLKLGHLILDLKNFSLIKALHDTPRSEFWSTPHRKTKPLWHEAQTQGETVSMVHNPSKFWTWFLIRFHAFQDQIHQNTFLSCILLAERHNKLFSSFQAKSLPNAFSIRGFRTQEPWKQDVSAREFCVPHTENILNWEHETNIKSANFAFSSICTWSLYGFLVSVWNGNMIANPKMDLRLRPSPALFLYVFLCLSISLQ